jgi:carbamoylphosphate synthase large subunit
VKRPILTNHALLFPDQPLLAAGRFEVLIRDNHRTLRTVTAWSDHFYYSPRSTTMKQDIMDRSDAFLPTLGHLFASLKEMGVPLAGLRLRKF